MSKKELIQELRQVKGEIVIAKKNKNYKETDRLKNVKKEIIKLLKKYE